MNTKKPYSKFIQRLQPRVHQRTGKDKYIHNNKLNLDVELDFYEYDPSDEAIVIDKIVGGETPIHYGRDITYYREIFT